MITRTPKLTLARMIKDQSQTKKVGLNIRAKTPELWDRCRAVAAENKATLNATVCALLEMALIQVESKKPR